MTTSELKALLDDYLPLGTDPTIHLATCDTAGPHVRPVTLVRDCLGFYFATSRCSDKIHHVGSQRTVELSCLLERAGKLGCLRIAGTLTEVSGAPLREAWNRAKGYDPSLHFSGGLEDPDFIAFRIEPKRIRLRVPGERETEVDADLFDIA